MDDSFPIQAKLTKKFLMQLPTGVFLVSNCHKSVGYNAVTPVFAEKVTALDDRDTQWQRIKNCSADSRNCVVHKDSESYKRQQEFYTKSSDRWPTVVLFEVDDPRR